MSICVMVAVVVNVVVLKTCNLTILFHFQKVVHRSLKIFNYFAKSVIKRKVIGYNL